MNLERDESFKKYYFIILILYCQNIILAPVAWNKSPVQKYSLYLCSMVGQNLPLPSG